MPRPYVIRLLYDYNSVSSEICVTIENCVATILVNAHHFVFSLYILYRQFRVELGDITPHNIKQLRKLNAAVFPIAYTDKVK